MASTTIPEKFLPVLTEKKTLAHLATVMPDGTPQVTPVWFFYADGKFQREHRARSHQGPQHGEERGRRAVHRRPGQPLRAHRRSREDRPRPPRMAPTRTSTRWPRSTWARTSTPSGNLARCACSTRSSPPPSTRWAERVRVPHLDLSAPLSDEAALAIADAGPTGELAAAIRAAACGVRDALFGRVVTYSPKVFLPLTNLCRNHCDYCSFRRSPGEAGEWTMTPAEIEQQLAARAGARLRRGALLPRRQAGEGLLGVSPHAGDTGPGEHRRVPALGRIEGPRARALAPHERGALDRRGHDAPERSERQPGADARVLEPAPLRARDAAPSRARQAARPAPGDDRRGRAAAHSLHDRHPRRHRRDAARAGGEPARDPQRAPPARARPRGHRAELPRRARRTHDSRPRARRRRSDARRGHGAPHPGRRRLPPGAPQPEPRVGRGAARVGAQRLRRHLARHARLHQPAPPLAAPRRAGPGCARAGFALRPRASIYDRFVERAGFLDPRLLAPTRDVQARLSAQGGPS